MFLSILQGKLSSTSAKSLKFQSSSDDSRQLFKNPSDLGSCETRAYCYIDQKNHEMKKFFFCVLCRAIGRIRRCNFFSKLNLCYEFVKNQRSLKVVFLWVLDARVCSTRTKIPRPDFRSSLRNLVFADIQASKSFGLIFS